MREPGLRDSGLRDSALRAAAMALAGTALVVAVRATRRRRQSWIAAGRYEHRALTETVDLPAHREHLYWLLRDPERAVRLLDPDARVVLLDATRCRATLTGPRGEPVTCLVEVVGDVPEMVVAWAVADGPLPHQGRVTLTPVPAGTQVRAQLRYAWSRRLQEESGIEPETPARVLRHAMNELRVQALSAQPYR